MTISSYHASEFIKALCVIFFGGGALIVHMSGARDDIGAGIEPNKGRCLRQEKPPITQSRWKIIRQGDNKSFIPLLDQLGHLLPRFCELLHKKPGLSLVLISYFRNRQDQ